jgi:hypothetical protein
MNQTVNTELVDRNGSRYLVALMPSASNPGKNYRTDVTNGRCDCPAWKFSKSVNGLRPPCKHLIQLGFTAMVQGNKAPSTKVPKAPSEPVVYPAGYLENL